MIEHPSRLVLYTPTELITRAPAPWQVRGLIREQSFVLLYGRRGCYKSFVALDIAACLSTGLAWHEQEVTQPGLVIYVAAEGGGGMVQRVRAWAEHHGVVPATMNMRFVVEPAVVTYDSDDMELLCERIKDAIDWHPADTPVPSFGYRVFPEATAAEWPVLIVIDTLARCFVGNENEQEDMGAFVRGCDRLKQTFNCSVMVIHHTGRDESHERGSTALGGAADTIYRLDADNANQSLTLTCEKMKDSAEPEPVELTYKVVDVVRRPVDDPKEELTSVVIQSPAINACGIRTVILDALTVGHMTWGELYRRLPGLTKTRFNKEMGNLRESGQIIKENEVWRRLEVTEIKE